MGYEYLSKSGVIVPDTADTKTGVINEFKASLGNDLDTDDSKPAGILINAETLARQSVANNNAAIANQINPNLAEGQFLDAIWALTGGSRLKATKTIVYSVLLTGVPGTIIPQNTIIQSGNNQFESISQVALSAAGNASVTFQALESGIIPCPVNTLKQIITPVLGLESVNNPLEGITGKEQESDQASRRRRKKTMALQGSATLESITSSVYNTEGVRSLTALENVTNVQQVIRGVSMLPHSIWLSVDGGTDTNVAQGIFAKKSVSSNINGKVIVKILSGKNPEPYEIAFDRPENILVYIRVTVSSSLSALDPTLVIPSIISQYAQGDIEGEDGLQVGVSVSPFEISGAINIVHPEFFIRKVELSTDGVNYLVDDVSIEVYQQAIITETMVSVVVV